LNNGNFKISIILPPPDRFPGNFGKVLNFGKVFLESALCDLSKVLFIIILRKPGSNGCSYREEKHKLS
jgi:hypothetical protein